MQELIIATTTWCKPCKFLKSRLEQEDLLSNVVIKDSFADFEFFKERNIKSVPQLLIIENGIVIESVYGEESIVERIVAEYHSDI